MTQPVPGILTPSMRLDKYLLVRLIGRGAFGEVWFAHDMTEQRDRAVKLVPMTPGESEEERLREARIGVQLEHKNLVRVHEAHIVGETNFRFVAHAMTYHPEGSVEVLANPAGYLPLPIALRIGEEILKGLEYLHTRNVLHNDIKPGNILLNSRRRAMLSDYGISGVSSNGAPVVAPNTYVAHRAPEVAATGNISKRSDIFQVGMTLARLLIHLDYLAAIRMRIGEALYEQNIAAGKLLTSKDFGSHIPTAVKNIVLKAVDPDPAKRFSSAVDMRNALERLDYPGHWTVDETGKEVGKCAKYVYSHSTESGTGRKFNVACKKCSIVSGNAQHVRKYCGRSLTKGQADKLVAKFKQFVVTGK